MRAIDVHAHPSTSIGLASVSRYNEAFENMYKVKMTARTEAEMAEDFRRADVKGILLAWDAETATGLPRTPNEYIASVVKQFPDAFIGGFGSVDPWKGQLAIREAEKAVKELGLLGLKFQQTAQEFFPNDRRFYPLWETCVGLKAAVQFHMGVTGLGSGMPGGMGIHLKYTQPIPYLDDVAADFPQLTIIACHPAWPWQEEMLAVAQHKANVFIELSGWSPKYFPPSLVREVGGRLQDKAMFGSDYPTLPHDRWLADFDTLGYKPEVVEKILYRNAQRVLGI